MNESSRLLAKEEGKMSMPRKRTFITSLISSLPTSESTNTSQNPLKQASAQERSILLALHVLFPNELLPALDLLDRELVTRLIVKSNVSTTEDQSTNQSRVVNQNQTVNSDQNVEHSRVVAQDETTMDDHDRPTNQGHISDQDQTATTTASEWTGETAQTLPRSLPILPDSDINDDKNHRNPIYYVKSAQHQSTHSRFRDPNPSTTHYEVRPLAWNCSCPAFIFSAFPASKPSHSETRTDLHGDNAHEDDSHMEAEAEMSRQEWKVGGLSLGEDVPMCKHLLACVLAERGHVFGRYVKTREVSAEEMAGWAAGWGG